VSLLTIDTEKGIPKDSKAGRQQFSKMMESRRAEESAADYDQLHKDWVLGSEEFRQELLAAASEHIGPSHFGAQRQKTAVQKAERLLKAELERYPWSQNKPSPQAKMKILLSALFVSFVAFC
jgi:hypothetical protein